MLGSALLAPRASTTRASDARMPTGTPTGGCISDRREFLKHLAGTTTGILFVSYGLLNAAVSPQKPGVEL
jgi:hypothetical protein